MYIVVWCLMNMSSTSCNCTGVYGSSQPLALAKVVEKRICTAGFTWRCTPRMYCAEYAMLSIAK